MANLEITILAKKKENWKFDRTAILIHNENHLKYTRRLGPRNNLEGHKW